MNKKLALYHCATDNSKSEITIMRNLLSFAILLTLTINASGQKPDDEWDVYMAQYEKSVGTTVINMSARKYGPVKSLPYVLITGVTTGICNPDGFPGKKKFESLYILSDSIQAQVNKKSKNLLVGTFTYDCQRLDYYYISDTVGLRASLLATYAKYAKGDTPYVNIKVDRDWEDYFKFLYPNRETLEYMKNQKVIFKLEEAGDKLEAPRQVDHFIYFSTESDRDCYVSYIQKQNFKIESREKIATLPKPYKLQISRFDKVDLSSISKLTLELRNEAEKCRGDYDGWETFVIK